VKSRRRNAFLCGISVSNESKPCIQHIRHILFAPSSGYMDSFADQDLDTLGKARPPTPYQHHVSSSRLCGSSFLPRRCSLDFSSHVLLCQTTTHYPVRTHKLDGIVCFAGRMFGWWNAIPESAGPRFSTVIWSRSKVFLETLNMSILLTQTCCITRRYRKNLTETYPDYLCRCNEALNRCTLATKR
jgi:hypothetical protein